MVSREYQGCTHLLPIPFIHLSFSLPLFTLHNSLSPISFTSIHPIALFCPAEVSSSLSLSLRPSSPLFHSALHLSISYFPFFLNLLFSLLFFVLCQVLIQGTSCDPCSPTSSPLCQALALFFLLRDGRAGRDEAWLKRERRQINQRLHFNLGTLDTSVTTSEHWMEQCSNWNISFILDFQ